MSRYPALSIISFILVLLGWIGILVGFGYFLIYEGIVEPNLPDHRFGAEDLIQIWTGLSAGIGGFLTLAAGEIIKVFVDIEFNTRRAAQAPAMDGRQDGRSGGREPSF